MSYLNSKPASAKELFVIDGSLPDIPTLINAIGAEKWIVVLDPQRDGVWQLAEIVSPDLDLSAIHVLSHGAAGSLSLGTSLLNQASLPAYAEALQSIGQALSDSGDILLYGCEVAQGESGQLFIAQFAAATGADVAASSDLTSAGGNWILEGTTGPINIGAPNGLVTAPYAHELSFPAATTIEDNLWSVMADFSVAAYQDSFTAYNNQVAGTEKSLSANWSPIHLTTSEGAVTDGAYSNFNASALVARSGDAAVTNFPERNVIKAHIGIPVA